MATSPNFGEAAYRAAARPTPKKPKPKPAPKPAGKPAPKAPPKTVGLSAAQQIVNASLAPLLASIKQQETQAGLGNLRQQDALSGFTKEIMSYLQGAPAAIQSDYQGAVDTTQKLAQASADQLLKSNPNSLNQADLAAIGAPQEQRDALAAQNQNVFGGGSSVLFKTAGAIPATQFAEDKATAKAFADSLPSIQGLSATQAFQKLLSKQAEGMQKFSDRRLEIEGKRPELVQEAQAAIDKQKSGSDKAPTVKRIGNAYYQWSGSDWVKMADYSPSDKWGTATLANGQKVTTLNGQPQGQPWGPVRTKTAAAGKAPTTRQIDGKVKQWNPQTGQWDTIGNAGATTASGDEVQPKTVPTLVKTRGVNALNRSLKNIFQQGFGSGIPKLIPDPAGGKKLVTNPAYTAAVAKYDAWLASGKSFKTVMGKVQNSIAYSLKKAGWTNSQIKQAAYEITATAIAPPAGYTPDRAAGRKNVSYVTPQSGIVTSKSWSGTHVTDGLGWGSKTATDIMGKPGTPVGAPESGVVQRLGSAQGGQSMYFIGDSGKVYWLGHIDGRYSLKPGTRVQKDQEISRISADHPRPHLHIDFRGPTV